MTKKILYALSVLLAGAAAYWSFDNKAKLEGEISRFEETRSKKDSVERKADKTEKTEIETAAELEKADVRNAELIADMENMKARETSMNRSKEEAQVKIDEQLKGVNVPWAQIPAEIKRQQEVRKKRGDDLDLLNEHIAKLTKDVADKRASNTRESDRLSKIRTKIARNAKVGAITSVNSTWGFVIVNLGTNNSNVTPQSKLLVTRNGRLLGRLTPNSVEASQTVCDLNARDINPGVRIQPGDQVTLADSSSGQ